MGRIWTSKEHPDAMTLGGRCEYFAAPIFGRSKRRVFWTVMEEYERGMTGVPLLIVPGVLLWCFFCVCSLGALALMLTFVSGSRWLGISSYSSSLF